MSTETVTPEIDMQTVFRTVSAQEDALGTISDLAFALMLVAEGLHTSAERGAVARLALYVSDHAERAETLRRETFALVLAKAKSATEAI